MDLLRFIKSESICQQPIIETKMNTGKLKVAFTAILQDMDKDNQNGRNYPSKVMKKGINNIYESIKTGRMIGEMDHPYDCSEERMLTVLMQNASHRIKEIYTENDLIMGLLETMRNLRGNELKNHIEDGYPVGFSIRAFADSDKIRKEDGYGYTEIIKDPIHIITYDTVTNPSHKIALFQKVIECKNIKNIIDEDYKTSKLLLEGQSCKSKKRVLTFNGEMFDKFLLEKVISNYELKWRKKFNLPL